MTDPDKPADPKLRELSEKIEALCKEYDCGAMISLHSQIGGDFRIVLPDWSYAKIERQESGDFGIRIRYKKGYDDDHDRLEATVAMLLGFKDISAIFFSQMDKLEKMLRQQIEIDHKPLWKK